MTSINLKPLSFGATPKEIANIKQACNELSEKIQKNEESFVSVDTTEINGKVSLFSTPVSENESKIKMKVLMGKNGDSFASTVLTEGSNEENMKYIKDAKNQSKIIEILDEMKSIFNGMNERNS